MFLLVNTCGGEGIVALAGEGAVLAVEVLPGRGTSESLMPAVRRVLGAVKVSELAGIGVVVGPGSFTGVRVGLSAMKGLCEAAGVRMVAMSRLDMVAAAHGGTAVALLDAGRGEFYGGAYEAGVMVWEKMLRWEEALAAMEGCGAVTCEVRVAEKLGAEVRVVAEPGAHEMLAMVEARVRLRQWSDVAAVDANYLRRTDAELAAERAALG